MYRENVTKAVAAARRARIVEALRRLPDGDAGERVRRAWATLRTRPDIVVALVLGAGVLVMVLHWR